MIFTKRTTVDWIAQQITKTLTASNLIPPHSSPSLSKAYTQFEVCAFHYALTAYCINSVKISESDKGPLLAAVAENLIQDCGVSGNSQTTRELFKLRLNNYFCEAQFGTNNPTHIAIVKGKAYRNDISIAGSYFLLLLGIPENDISIVPWHTYNLELVTRTVQFILDICTAHKLKHEKFKNEILPPLTVDLHEPPNKQIQDLFRQFQNHEFGYALEKFTEGLNCDAIQKGSGPFGSTSNPIPVNGPRGEIKYLAKLRSLSGTPVFFHRIGSFESTLVENPIDGYEIVSTDGKNWNTIYFDMYHPRRSNFAPGGYILKPYKVSLGEDPLLGFGVNFRVNNFPKELPEAIIDSPYYVGDKAAVRLAEIARGYTQKHDFSRPQ